MQRRGVTDALIGGRSASLAKNSRHKTKTQGLFTFFKKLTRVISKKNHQSFEFLQRKINNQNLGRMYTVERPKLTSQTSNLKIKQRSATKVENTYPKNHNLDDPKKNQKIKELQKRKQELMDKLKKIDNELHSKASDHSHSSNHNYDHLKESALGSSALRMKKQETFPIEQHSKAMEMIQRLNTEKLKRQQKLIIDMKKKQENELKKIHEIEHEKQEEMAMRNRQNLQRSRSRVQNSQAMFNKIPLPINHQYANVDIMPKTFNQNQFSVNETGQGFNFSARDQESSENIRNNRDTEESHYEPENKLTPPKEQQTELNQEYPSILNASEKQVTEIAVE